MASKRDLVEAHAFNRRRLVTAFLSGAPGGREVEPARYGRTIVGGVVVAALLVAGSAVTGILKPAAPSDWLEPGMVIGKQSGSRFVVNQDKRLFPVINTTSARLFVGASGHLKVTYVDDDLIAKHSIGVTIGIPGAPDYLPSRANLVESGWTACTDDLKGTLLRVAATPAATPATGKALVVRAPDRGLWVVTGSHRYPVPKGATGTAALRAFGLDRVQPVDVPDAWLGLVPTGAALKPFTVPGSGSSTTTKVAGLDVVGTPVRAGSQRYVLGRDGLLPVTPFAYDLYRSSANAAVQGEKTVDPARLSELTTVNDADARPYPASWPTADVSSLTTTHPCVVLQRSSDAGRVGSTVLATATSDAAVPTGSGVTTQVQTGHGALVRATSTGSADAATSVVLVDQLGQRYTVGDKGQVPAAQKALGYGTTAPQAAPEAWTDLFDDGPALSPKRAVQAATQ